MPQNIGQLLHNGDSDLCPGWQIGENVLNTVEDRFRRFMKKSLVLSSPSGGPKLASGWLSAAAKKAYGSPVSRKRSAMQEMQAIQSAAQQQSP